METVLVTAPTYPWKTLENGVGYIGNERGQFHFALTICGSVIYEFSADTEPERHCGCGEHWKIYGRV